MKIRILATVALAGIATFPADTSVSGASLRSIQGSATTTLTVHTHVVRNCTVSATPVDFGRYDPLVAHRTQPLDATGTVTVGCTKGTKADVELDSGSNRPNTYAGNSKFMVSGGDSLEYQLFQDTGRTRRWSGFIGAVHFPVSAGGTATATRTVYGRVFAGQNVAPGDYDDTVTVTVKF